MQIRDKRFGQWVEVEVWRQSWEPEIRVDVTWSVPCLQTPLPLSRTEAFRRQLGLAIKYAKALRREIARRKKAKRRKK